MNIKKIVVGLYEENCYFLTINNDLLIVDPGDEFNKIDNIISKNYDQECEYIIKLDKNHYKGDMACLSALGNHVLSGLKSFNLDKYIKIYNIYNKATNDFEDFLED